jgi:mannitol/fructose-specific phosphotransferase system IIA component (Ntr-type)
MLGAKETPVRLGDVIREADIHLDLAGDSEPDVLGELVAALGLSPEDSASVLRVVQRRESMGSTGIGHGVAVPHCRTPLVDRLHVVFGRQARGVGWCGADAEPVRFIFLLVAPPVEVSNDYLPMLGKVARFANDPEARRRLGEISTREKFFQLIAGTGL